MEEKIFLAKLLYYFDFTTKEDLNIAKLSELILRPARGVPMTAQPRRPLPRRVGADA